MRIVLRTAMAAMPIATSFFALTAAHAQTTVEAADQGLTDIVVTAEKRPSQAQKTPIAIGIVSAEQIARNNIGSIEDLSKIAPSLGFQQAHTQAIISIRGVSSRDTSEIGDPAVGISIDGTYFQRAIGLNATLFDVERIEVLRGPQGTLLGRNATGGAVNIITAKPVDHFAASFSGEVGNYDALVLRGMVNLPVSDTLKLRASFQTRDHSGYRDNYPAKDGDDEHSKAARLTALFTPIDRLSITLTGEYSHLSGVGPVIQGVTRPTTSTGAVDLETMPDIPNDGRKFPLTPGGFIDIETYSARWNVDYDFDFATLTYLGGYRHLDFERLSNYGTVYGTSRQNASFYQHEKPETWNHELRLASKSGPFKWQIGGFYFREANNLTTEVQDYPGSVALAGAPVILQHYRYPKIVSESKAAFGQLGYSLTSTLEIEAGARYSDNKKTRDGSYYLTNSSNYFNSGAISYSYSQQNSKSASKIWTYHGGVNWQFSPVNLLYAKVDTGFKDGGFTEYSSYEPEHITAYEIGSKNRFFGNTLQVNLSAFWYDYKDQQVSQYVNVNGNTINNTLNAGKSRYKGAELEVNWLPTPSDHLDAFVGYTHAEYIDFVVALSGVNTQLAGKTPPQAPRWSVNLGYSHDFDIGVGMLTPRVQTHIESESYFTIYNRASDHQKGYTRSDLMLTFKPTNGRWTLDAFVRNLEDRTIFTNAFDPNTTSRAANAFQYAAPRTYGARLSVDF